MDILNSLSSKLYQGPADANLQLALALSASLRSAEEKELIEEAEVLNSVGLSEEAREKLGTLERFGFAALQPPQSSTGMYICVEYI